MNEKVLIEAKFTKTNLLAILSAGIALVTLLYSMWWDNRIHSWGNLRFHNCIEYYTPFLVVGIPMLILTTIFYFWMNNCKLTVTDKRVYGKAAFGKRVDLPFDMISASATGPFNSLVVATSSGKIGFWLLTNRNEVFNVISDVLIARQSKNSTTDSMDELRKCKALFDDGIITEEEFQLKKKQLLEK